MSSSHGAKPKAGLARGPMAATQLSAPAVRAGQVTGPKKRKSLALQTASNRSSIVIEAFYYGGDGALVHDSMEPAEAVYALHILHSGRPSVTYQMKNTLEQFLATDAAPAFGRSVESLDAWLKARKM